MGESLRHVVRIPARPDVVFQYLVDPDLVTRWMGARAVIAATPGTAYEFDINGVLVRGEVIEAVPPKRLVISWGHLDSAELPPGSSTVTFTLVDEGGSTLLEVTHHDLPDAQAEPHAVGWPHFLGRLEIAAVGGDPGPDPFATEST